MKKRMAELFAGVGGFHVGLDDLNSNWNCVYANQYEPGKRKQNAFECYKQHYSNEDTLLSNTDINKVNKNNIPDMDLLTGGFPCQDYSVAHSGDNKGIKGKKGVLWWAINETLRVKKPPFVLLENVDRLLKSPTKQRGRDFGMILYTLSQLGYGVQWRVINAADYGFPQKRKRTFIFAYKNSTKYYNQISNKDMEYSLINNSVYMELPIKEKLENKKSTNINGYKDIVDFSNNFKFHFENTGILHDNNIFTGKYTNNYQGKYTTLNDILLNSVNNNSLFLHGKKYERLKELKTAKKINRTSKTGHKYTFSQGNMSFPDNLNKPARTIITSEHNTDRSTHVIKDKENGKLRLLDPIECERIQTFPDNWTKGLSNSQRYFMMGNALVCGLITKLGKQIDEIIEIENK